jgi:hypothetical protein
MNDIPTRGADVRVCRRVHEKECLPSLEVVATEATSSVAVCLEPIEGTYVITSLRGNYPAALHAALREVNTTLHTIADEHQRLIKLNRSTLTPVELGAFKDANGYPNHIPPVIDYWPQPQEEIQGGRDGS